MRRPLLVVAVLVLAALSLRSRADEPSAADPYAAAEPRTVAVGGTLDLVVPGVVTQLICDGVDTVLAVDGDTLDTLHVHGLAPGVGACTIHGLRDIAGADGGTQGNTSSFVWFVKITVVARTPAAPSKPVPARK
jgi:hypothetical protein